MSRTDYSLVLPAYTIGSHAYDSIGKITKHFGKKSSSSAAKQPLKKQSNRS